MPRPAQTETAGSAPAGGMSRLTVGLAVLRLTGIAALVLLVWNPPWLFAPQREGPPLVLLDASLSLGGQGGRWAEALDSARHVGRGGVIWRFGDRVAAFDTAAPRDGSSRLAAALEAAAGRPGPITVVTDGELGDLATVPPDLRARPRVIVLPRSPFANAFVVAVAGQRRLAATDTLWLRVSVGVAGGEALRAGRPALAVRGAGRRLAVQPLHLPDTGVIVVPVTVPARRLPAGLTTLTVALEEIHDAEPRDDARLFVVETVAQPPIVVLGDPPDWDTRFAARTLASVARAPVRTFVRLGGATGWRDAATLRPVDDREVARSVAAARLLVHGPGTAVPGAGERTARLVLGAPSSATGDWYVTPPPPSPLAAALAGIAWDSLPPLAAASPAPGDTVPTVVLGAAPGRRGRVVPVVTLRQRADGQRVAALRASGLWRWAFRGGAAEVAYRALLAGVTDWLLRGTTGPTERFAPVVPEAPQGTPLTWRWSAPGTPGDVALRVSGPAGDRVDTLRFDASGHATLRWPVGIHRFAALDGPERGLVAVETYSDEWRRAPVTLAAQDGTTGRLRLRRGVRDAWWLFALAIAAFAAEWTWRRRAGLP